MTKNNQANNKGLLKALSLQRLSLIHRDIASYYEKWDQEQVIQIADLSTIENTYTALLHNLSQIASATGAGIYLFGEINGSSNYYKGIGGSITVTSLGINFLVSAYKERRYQPEERKKEKDKLVRETENLYQSYQELVTLLQPLRLSDSSPELNKLVKSLKERLAEIIKKGEVKENSKRVEYLSYIFWSLEKDKSSDLKELILLNNGVKALDSWNDLSFSGKAQSWLNSLFISRRNDAEWTNWKQEWESRRSEHEKIKCLTEILQFAISKYKQGIDSNEIEEGIKTRMLELTEEEIEKETDIEVSISERTETVLENKKTLSTGSSSWLPGSFRKRTVSAAQESKSSPQETHELVNLSTQKEQLETQVQIPPK